MSEIEKMYENVGVELIEGLEWVCQNPDHCTYQNLSIVPENCSGCEYFEREMAYPPFTAEKQIELICFLLNADIKIDICKDLNMKMEISDIAEALAEVTNTIWQDLTPEEKQQVKGILE